MCYQFVSLQAMVGQVSSLMKTVKNVEDEAARGVQSLEATIDNIESDLKVCVYKHNVHVHVHVYSIHVYIYIECHTETLNLQSVITVSLLWC